MFTNPMQITYNAVTKDLEKVNQQDYTGLYYLDDDTVRFNARVAHTVPKPGQPGESHLLRLDADQLDATTYELVRRDSVWIAARTDFGVQNTTELDYLADSLIGLMTAANIGKLLSRQT